VTEALRMSEAKPRNKVLDRCNAPATMILICAFYDKAADIVMPRSKTFSLLASKTPFK